MSKSLDLEIHFSRVRWEEEEVTAILLLHKLVRLASERGLPPCIIIAVTINNLYLMRSN